MNITQVWVSIREDFDMPGEDPELDTPLQASNREALSRATDIDVVPNLFKKERLANKDWTVYILTYEYDLPREVEQAVERLASENPGQTKELGAWDFDGKMFGTDWVYGDVTRDVTVQDPDWDTALWPQIPNPDYPDFSDEPTIDDPAFTPPTIVIQVTTSEKVGTSGVPLYPRYGNLLRYMPDVWDGNAYVTATELTDVNLLMGQEPRRWT